MIKTKYQALSPDGFPINCEGGLYETLKEAKQAIKEFANNYKVQGYYSQVCNNGYKRHISIPEIPDYCDIIAVVE